ncbi:MAG: 16S rRNA (cytosine(1402)-N(4))-methyltransferase RsmH [Dehalococcoidia bacterium]|nr:16S rRNA (cytosine(1402)-N(4))-methyltransferase RsmH [Dehalococcoidia bacterium]
MLSVAHKPVLLKETIAALSVQPGGRYIDCTLGDGGHALAILEQSTPGGQLLGIDADPAAIRRATDHLSKYRDSVLIVQGNFADLDTICQRYSFAPVHGVLLDLGLSSEQLDEDPRGFSFQRDAELDMRFDPAQETTAADIINNSSETELALILREFGEEPYARRIARRIGQVRPIKTTMELAKVVEQAVGGRHGKIHPATRTFQALRIAVNRELENLETALGKAVEVLGTGGRLVVISYHSLEDRIVKHFTQRESRDCICPPNIPVCDCGHTASLRVVNKKIIIPSEEEIRDNPRSRSAKMRVAEKIERSTRADTRARTRFSQN